MGRGNSLFYQDRRERKLGKFKEQLGFIRWTSFGEGISGQAWIKAEVHDRARDCDGEPKENV